MRRLLVWSFALTVVVAGGAFTGVARRAGSGPEPGRANSGEIPQIASAQSQGVALRALAAAFSGTSTIVRLRIDADRAAVAATAGAPGITGITVSRDGFDAAGWAGYTLTTGQLGPDEVIVTLPAMVPSIGYDGTVRLRIMALDLRTPSGVVRLAGTWELELRGPDPSAVAMVLRTEEFVSRTADLDGLEVRFSGSRSAGETTIRAELADTTIVLGQPSLTVGSESFVASRVQRQGASLAMVFPPTPFGSTVRLVLGPLARPTGAAMTVKIAIGAALQRANGQPDFAITPGDVLEGDSSLVLGGTQGSYTGRKWVGIRITGNWHPQSAQPRLFDVYGNSLDLAHVQVGYSKDAGGNVLPGVTDIAGFLDDVTPATLTVVVGPESVIHDIQTSVNLAPR